MRQRDRQAITEPDSSPSGGWAAFPDAAAEHDGSLFDGPDSSLFDAHGSLLTDHRDDGAHDADIAVVQRVSRREERAAARGSLRRRRSRQLVTLSVVLFVGVLVATTALVVMPLYRHFHPADYSGSGTGRVTVTVRPDEGTAAIGQSLHAAGVVASVQAFTDAAADNSSGRSVQPGTYTLHRHMAARQALALLLRPVAAATARVVVPEGATVLDVQQRLVAKPCSAGNTAAVCGPGMSAAEVRSVFADVTALGLPTDYNVGGRTPTSLEGFLFPATYPFTVQTKPADAVQQMLTAFSDRVRALGFTGAAKALRITPYQELIVASIAQAEAKFPADLAKVARVVLNRLAAGTPLQIDATSAYAAKLAHLDPTKVVYSRIDSPYNTYRNAGLPPTPIGNPGLDAMKAAAAPAAGNWLYYVNSDAAGHLFFTNSEAAFTKAVATCRAHHWGCG